MDGLLARAQSDRATLALTQGQPTAAERPWSCGSGGTKEKHRKPIDLPGIVLPEDGKRFVVLVVEPLKKSGAIFP
jgi:hypothetical protein